jgi:hypothetical protein
MSVLTNATPNLGPTCPTKQHKNIRQTKQSNITAERACIAFRSCGRTLEHQKTRAMPACAQHAFVAPTRGKNRTFGRKEQNLVRSSQISTVHFCWLASRQSNSCRTAGCSSQGQQDRMAMQQNPLSAQLCGQAHETMNASLSCKGPPKKQGCWA